MNSEHKNYTFCLVAGEASGDLLGEGLIRALESKAPGHCQFIGVGGPRMKRAGQEQIFPADDLAVMGVAEVVPRLPLLLKRLKQTQRLIEECKPDVLITIDAPDFNFRLARRCRHLNMARIHYVAPTVWAWRPRRAATISKFLDHLMALFPFEPPYFEKEGLPCTFVGHPVIHQPSGQDYVDDFYHVHPQMKGRTLLTLLPGSRSGEVRRLLPVFVETAKRLCAENKDLSIVLPTVPAVEGTVRDICRQMKFDALITTCDEEKYAAFALSKAALAASGTVSLELAMARLPHVVAYRVNPLTAFLFRRLARVQYVSLVNIMHHEMIVPELLQEQCTVSSLRTAVQSILTDPAAWERQGQKLAEVSSWLGYGRSKSPDEYAAEVVWTVLGNRRKNGGLPKNHPW